MGGVRRVGCKKEMGRRRRGYLGGGVGVAGMGGTQSTHHPLHPVLHQRDHTSCSLKAKMSHTRKGFCSLASLA